MNRLINVMTYSTAAAILMLLLGTSVAQDDTQSSRGYTTTPQELQVIAEKARAGIEPYKSAVAEVLDWADRSWDYEVDDEITCRNADNPRWIDERGAGIVYANALGYHLTGETFYAARVAFIIEKIMVNVVTIPADPQQCRLNFAWGIPEYVAAADLMEEYWHETTCLGPTTTIYGDETRGSGPCKQLFQNWLAKNPYYVVSYSALAQSNWGAAATNATAYIADYLWDRPEITLIHRHPPAVEGSAELALTPAQAYAYANQLMLDRLNGYGVEHDSSSSCDYLNGRQQDNDLTPVKSQFSERGIIPEDARREEFCNINRYNGEYQNYPQIHINNTLQQCELMLRRGDPSCYDNISLDEIPEYHFVGPDGQDKVTHLYPGRGSIERAINAIIVDSGTEWRHDSALYVAYRYYLSNSRFGQVGEWYKELERSGGCSQGICFGKLTHGFAQGETPALPLAAVPLAVPPPPSDN